MRIRPTDSSLPSESNLNSPNNRQRMNTNQTSAPGNQELWEQIVSQRVGRLRFGAIQLVVHDGRVTQVETTEKTRLPAEAQTAAR